jgi:septal ring factor EnvC (AmiA/AmiB activator)
VAVTARKTKLLDAEIALETEAVSQIDWKKRWETKVSDEIENKAKYSAKLADAHRELAKARMQIADLDKMVIELSPMKAKLDAEREARKKSDAVWATKIEERDAEIKKLKLHQGRGQRQVMEDVIQWIQAKADKMPEPVREPEIDLDPPTAGVFE